MSQSDHRRELCNEILPREGAAFGFARDGDQYYIGILAQERSAVVALVAEPGKYHFDDVPDD